MTRVILSGGDLSVGARLVLSIKALALLLNLGHGGSCLMGYPMVRRL